MEDAINIQRIVDQLYKMNISSQSGGGFAFPPNHLIDKMYLRIMQIITDKFKIKISK